MIRILIVDDDVLIRDFFMLHGPREMDAVFSVASSANDAILLLSEGWTFDVIISDYQMDNGNGADLFSYLYQNNITVVSALYTSSPDPKLRVMNKGFIGKFDKLELSTMLTRIRAALAERR
jgi:DNA-binding NtrC family response regulator